MKRVLVDSNVVLDVFLNDPKWADWSESKLDEYDQLGILYINSIVYSEISIGFDRIEDLESAIVRAGFQMLEIPKEALFWPEKLTLNTRKERAQKELRSRIFLLAHRPPSNIWI